MDVGVDASSRRQLRIGGADDRVDFKGYEVGDDDFELRLA